MNWCASPYVRLLARIHAHLLPRTYVEIGVRYGDSLCLALPGTRAIGIDPNPQITMPLDPDTRIFPVTSDEFFAQSDVHSVLDGLPADLAFIDGMHNFEFSLRDFINVERCSGRESTILIHDCYPIDEETSTREHNTYLWSGDVWRLVLALKEYRPDLEIATADVAPTGLGIIRNLDPQSTVLADRYQEIVDKYLEVPYSVLDRNKGAALNRVAPDWDTVKGLLPAQPFRNTSATWLVSRRAARLTPPALQKARDKARRRTGAAARRLRLGIPH